MTRERRPTSADTTPAPTLPRDGHPYYRMPRERQELFLDVRQKARAAAENFLAENPRSSWETLASGSLPTVVLCIPDGTDFDTAMFMLHWAGVEYRLRIDEELDQ